MRALPRRARASTGASPFRYPDGSRAALRRDTLDPHEHVSLRHYRDRLHGFRAPAWANPELAQKKNCMACHAVDQKVIGPSYKEVAAKYAGQADAVAKLVPKVMKGGSGVWGAVPMPANPQVNEAEAKQLVQWILTLK